MRFSVCDPPRPKAHLMATFEAMERPEVSIVIVNRNTRELLRACLRSIDALPDRVSREVVVIDNASNDGSREMLTADFPTVRVIHNAENTGFSFPNNQGIQTSTGRLVLLLNSDTEILPYALDRMADALDAHPDAGACGARLLFPDGSHQASCFSFPTPLRHMLDMVNAGALFPRSRVLANQRDWFDHGSTRPVDWVMGAALMVRREVVESVGLLDERFRLYCNEVDWCFRMRNAGWRTYFVHDAEIIHHCGGTRQEEDRDFRLQGELLQNHFDYALKHYGALGLGWYRLWLGLGFLARDLRIRVKNRIHPTDAGRSHARLVRGILKVAVTGRPDSFPVSDDSPPNEASHRAVS